MPPEVEEARFLLYYVLTKDNLYCLSLADHSVKQLFYKREISTEEMPHEKPGLKQFGFLVVKQRFSLILAIQSKII